MSNDTKNERERLSLRVSPMTAFRLHMAYKQSTCRSKNELAEQAINFYLDYLDTEKTGDFLPAALRSYVDGRLGKFEDRLSSLAFKHSVELDMLSGIIADAVRLDEDELRRRRAESVQNVKKTNGRISFEKHVRDSWDEEDEAAWQS